MSVYKYFTGNGVDGVSKDGSDIKIDFPNSVPIDYDVYKDIKDKPQTFKDKFEIKEKIVKGEKIKIVEARDVSKDSKPTSEDNPK